MKSQESIENIQIRCEYQELVDPKDLKPNPSNRNVHPQDQIDRLAKIIQFQGFRHPIVVSKRSGFMVAGHGRLDAAKQIGMDRVPVDYQDFPDDESEYAFLISDNAIASWAELDLSGIHRDLEEIGPFDIDLLGIQDFQFEPVNHVPGCDEDEVPDAPAEPKTKRGDIYQLGRHRLMCGDSTAITDVEALMCGEKVEMVFTDPPYRQSKSVGGFNDTRPGWADHKADQLNDFEPAETLSIAEILDAQSAYFFCNKDLLGQYLEWAKRFGGWDLLVMAKANPIPTKHKKYLSDVEWLVFARREGAYFDDTLEYDHYRKVRTINVKEREHGHPTEKQVAYIEPYLKISAPPSGIVLDLFGGSGTTLIACEKTSRRCFMMELDPKYCDVIVARWEKFTGGKAELVTGM